MVAIHPQQNLKGGSAGGCDGHGEYGRKLVPSLTGLSRDVAATRHLRAGLSYTDASRLRLASGYTVISNSDIGIADAYAVFIVPVSRPVVDGSR